MECKKEESDCSEPRRALARWMKKKLAHVFDVHVTLFRGKNETSLKGPSSHIFDPN